MKLKLPREKMLSVAQNRCLQIRFKWTIIGKTVAKRLVVSDTVGISIWLFGRKNAPHSNYRFCLSHKYNTSRTVFRFLSCDTYVMIQYRTLKDTIEHFVIFIVTKSSLNSRGPSRTVPSPYPGYGTGWGLTGRIIRFWIVMYYCGYFDEITGINPY